MSTIYIETYGCQMNVADTELMFGHLGRNGYSRADDPATADVLLLNTCAIRENAEERIIGRLGQLARFKARRPSVQLGIAGCMAQHVRDRLLHRLPFVDFVVGPDAYRRLPELLRDAGGDPFVDVRLDRDETYADIAPARSSGVRGWVTIMRGCDKFCTFCIVPYVRGRERSLPADAILAQVRDLADDGCREIVFLGQTVNAYRDGDTDFASLLRRTNEIGGVERIRFTSPHPSDMNPAVVAAMGECDKVCPQLHLPLQSGSDRILERMARDYSVASYRRLVDDLRVAVPGIALSTDIIVGFPGETDADFEATLAVMDEVGYDSAFMFQYSPRSMTKAAKFEDTVPDDEKARRLQQVIAAQRVRSESVYRSQIGSVHEVLVEAPARRREGWLVGKTPHFRTTVFPSGVAQPGDLVHVTIDDASTQTLIGSIATPEAARRDRLAP